MDRAIFNLHVPPKDSRLDTAALLNPDLSPVMRSGMPVMAGVGSSAVRTAIERHQPPIALHGHIHESRGETKIGRTVCVNPGSEYSDGVLRGAIVTLSERGLKGVQLLSG
jgi:Icc-related predicted phosphoesterase